MRESGRTKMIVMIAFFIAMDVVLSRLLSINTPILRIGFGFVPIAICAMMYGPVWAGVTGALADIIGAILIPGGAYFPGFTISSALVGVVFGLFLYKSKGNWMPILFATAINCFVISLFLTTFWLSVLWGTPYLELLPVRLLQSSVMVVIQFTVLITIEKTMGTRIRRVRYEHKNDSNRP
ncbi:MAG: folate family ECF transporter S component [Defluviitaleaceae bacterium]|nr:folate family ECF transporter S component [Defluviitaleaceae bacterium]